MLWIENHLKQPIDPIEIEIYEPAEKPGYLKYVGNKTIEQVFNELVDRLRKEGYYPDEYFEIIDDFNEEHKQEFPIFRWIACFPVTGGSEGHYIHVEVIIPGGTRKLLYLGKTFQGFEFAAKVAMACAKHLGA